MEFKIKVSSADKEQGKNYRRNYARKSGKSGGGKKTKYQVSEEVSLNEIDHDNLLEHCMQLIGSASYQRAERIGAMESTEYDLLGVAEPEGSDCDRYQNRVEGRGAAQPDRIFPFGYLKLQKYAADLLAIIMPYEAPYAVVTNLKEQDRADALTKALRYHAAIFDHRSNITATIFDALSLDIGAMRCSWDIHGYGAPAITGETVTKEIKGSRITHLDPYNITWDASLMPHEVPEHGEFFAVFDLTSKFHIKRMVAQNKAFISNEELDEIALHSHNYYYDIEQQAVTHSQQTAGRQNYGGHYYFNPRLNRGRHHADRMQKGRSDDRNGKQTDFSTLFNSQGSIFHSSYIDGNYAPKGVKTTVINVRLIPSDYGLTDNKAIKDIEIYKIMIINDEQIIYAAPQEYANDRFDIVLGNMSFGREWGRQMNHGDAIADLSAFMSSILNTYKRSKRQSLEGGVTLYNPDVIPLNELDEMHGGRLPIRQMRYDDNIERHVHQLSDPPDTKNDMQDAAGVLDLINTLLPTNAQPELAGLDRATEYQAQAVALTGDRDLMMHASILDGQFITPLRWLIQYYVYSHNGDMTYVDEKNRRVLELTSEQIRASHFQITQPGILMGVDRLRMTSLLQNMVNTLIQVGDQLNPVALMMLKHFIDLSGINIDLADYEEAVQQSQAQQAEQQAASVDSQQAQAEVNRARAQQEQQPQQGGQ